MKPKIWRNKNVSNANLFTLFKHPKEWSHCAIVECMSCYTHKVVCKACQLSKQHYIKYTFPNTL